MVGKSRENAGGKGKREGKLGPVVGRSNEKLSAGEKGPRHGEKCIRELREETGGRRKVAALLIRRAQREKVSRSQQWGPTF